MQMRELVALVCCCWFSADAKPKCSCKSHAALPKTIAPTDILMPLGIPLSRSCKNIHQAPLSYAVPAANMRSMLDRNWLVQATC